KVRRYVTRSINGLFWNFLNGLIATLHSSLPFFYAMQLFWVFSMFETMQTVLTAVKLKYMEFMSTGILILILILFYSTISVFYFQNQFLDSDSGVRTIFKSN